MFRSNAFSALYLGFVLTASSAWSQNPSAPPQSPNQAESSGTWRGRIETLIVDNFQAGTSRTRLFLRTSSGTLELQAAEAAHLHSGQLVNVTGRLSGGRLLASQLTVAGDDVALATCGATGEQRAAVILASFPSKALLSSVTPELVRTSFFGDGRTLDQFLRESSFGQTWITGDVLGPYVLDADYFDQPLAVRDAALRAAAPYADLTQYNRIFVVAPQGQTGMDSGGMALLGCGQISSPQGDWNASSIWMGAESMLGQNEIVDTASHELGHGFGLEHARFADFGNDALGPVGAAAAPWDALHDYGDSYSNMGRQSAQWASPQKALLGWLQPGANITNVTAAGNFTLSPYESQGGSQVLRISRDPAGAAWLWLEYRQPNGTFDSTLPPPLFAGALVHYEDPALTSTKPGVDPATYSNLVNFHPSGTLIGDPVLHAGETWNDPYGNLSLTVNSASAGLNVTVAYAAAPSCPSSVGGAQSFDAAGGNGTIAVSAPAACSWTSTASVPWIAVASAGSGAGTGNVSFTVAPNVDMAPRWGKITVGEAFVIVNQAGASDGWITISPQGALVSAEGGTGEIAVATSAPDFAWTMGTDASWITDVECSCFLDIGPATLRYIVAVNTGAERTGHINVGGIAFTITQQASRNRRQPLVSFSELAPHDAPNARLNQAMAPFGQSGQAILYGGAWDNNFSAATWLWNGSDWTALNPAHNPGLIANHAMAYDEARGQIVLFGGISGSTFEWGNQTWVWDGNDWTQMHPMVSPPERFGHAMVYDSVLRKVVLFGGYGDFGDLNDTWTWDGANWNQVVSSENPSPRSGHSMAFDAARGQIVLFGGMRDTAVPAWYTDTWLWDQAGWHQAFPAVSPAGRSGHVLAYHPALQAVVMIGGAGGKDITDTTWNYDFRKETWTWDGAAWTQQFPENQPGAAYTISAAYDNTTQSLTVHLGDDLTCVSRGPKTFHLTTPYAALPRY